MKRNTHLYGHVLNWDDIPEEEIRHGVRRRAYATDQVMLVMNWLSPGMDLNPHKHDDTDQLAYILEGRANYYIDGVPHEMAPGSMLLVPAGSVHYIEPLGDQTDTLLNLDVFVPPREDLLHLVEYVGADEAAGREPST